MLWPSRLRRSTRLAQICPVCFWEDDPIQLRWPRSAIGANKVSLIDAQGNYQAFGSSDGLT
ncbi:CPCC family cysteine-rich protein [Nocardia sp. NPDC004860]|uniref:CPCC family cysteine-rich protein n=1 Tax=Nocardia sp. NPDC004860 TaxID=3154557 RepID=UPI0033A59533